MCLLIAAVDAHPRYSLVLVGHRDEFHARPTAPLAWWPDHDGVLAGRDLEAGGTWLGVGRDGRAAVITNFRDPARPVAGAPSRGRLIPDFLAGHGTAHEYAERATREAARYAGFNLLLIDGTAAVYVSNRPGVNVSSLAAGIYGLSNHRLDTPWPKVLRTRARVTQLLSSPALTVDSLLAALRDRLPAGDDELPETGVGKELERLLSAPFIVSPGYGTRSASAVLVGRDGSVVVHERRYDPHGSASGHTTFAFQSVPPRERHG